MLHEFLEGPPTYWLNLAPLPKFRGLNATQKSVGGSAKNQLSMAPSKGLMLAGCDLAKKELLDLAM